MKKLMVFVAVLCIASLAVAADHTVVGKNGETLPYVDQPAVPGDGGTRADVEYNTAGAIDAPATTGGSSDGWGEYFITAWANLTGQDVYIAEFGWPCGGAGPVDWVVWVTDGSLPGAPGSQNFSGQFTPASGDPDELPPTTYTYIDVSDAGVVVPADQVMYFGYQNPGIGGQIDFNGTDTWAWYFGAWDPDAGWGRTAVLQFKGNYDVVPTQSQSLTNIKALF